jgi:hypothetical protein
MYHICLEPHVAAAVVDSAVCALTLQSFNVYGRT